MIERKTAHDENMKIKEREFIKQNVRLFNYKTKSHSKEKGLCV